MPSISKIRLTNIVYEEGNKRYNDEMFLFDGHNGAILLENGGGKTVLIHTALQAIFPHVDLAERKIKKTLMLENAPAHIAIEWIDHDNPRRYVVTAVSLFTTKQGIDSLRYVYEYDANDPNGIEGIPFVRDGKVGKRTAERGEMQEYYAQMRDKTFSARTFQTIKEFRTFIEDQYHIVASEWESIVKINSSEGGVEAFFDECKSTNQLFDRLLIPTVENSIAGHEATMFADLFEQQHSSFKNYKKLKQTIEENKKIQEHLEGYVHTYQSYDQCEQDYQKVKSEMKGTWNESKQQKHSKEAEHADVLEKLADWKARLLEYQVSMASYEIFQEKTTFQIQEKEYKEVYGEKVETEEKLKQQLHDYYSLKLAELKKDRKQEKIAIEQIKRELSEMNRSEEVEDIKEQLEEAKQMLLGAYLTELEVLEQEKQELIYMLNPIIEEVEQLNDRKQDQIKAETHWNQISSKMIAINESRSKDMKQIRQQILANPQQEQVSEKLATWQKKSQWLDEETVRLQQEGKQLDDEVKQIEQNIDSRQEEYVKLEQDKNQTNFYLDAVEQAEQQIMGILTELRPQWMNLEGLYLSQDSIEQRLTEQLDSLTRERQELLYRERLAYRFVDDYKEQAIFFADPYLEEQSTKWKNQFDYIVTGVEYVQSLPESEKQKVEAYPLWSMTLVTTNQSKHKVIEKIKSGTNNLQYPIRVVSTEEALDFSTLDFDQDWIAPSHWKNNLSLDLFDEWKKGIQSQANQTTQLREEKEREIKRWDDGKNRFHAFLNQYPFYQVSEWKQLLAEQKHQLERMNARLKEDKRQKVEQQQLVVRIRKNITEHQSEKQGLDVNIEKAVQYLHYEKEVEEAKKAEKEAQKELTQVKREISRIQRDVNRLEEEKVELQTRIHTAKAVTNSLMQEDEYQAIKELTPIYSEESKQNCRVRVQNFEMKLRQIIRSEGELLAKKEAIEKSIQRLNKQIDDLLLEHKDIDEQKPFPSDGKQVMEKLWERKQQLNEDLNKLMIEVEKKASTKNTQQGKWQMKVEHFEKEFPDHEVIVFSKSMEEINSELAEIKAKLDDRKLFIDQEMMRVEKELTSIEEALYHMDKYIEAHHFNAPDIIPIELTTEQVRDFSYQRMDFVKNLTNRLKQKQALTVSEYKQVEKARNYFREFCRKEISEIKLQQMAINGVETKQTYPDVLDFRKNMMTRIEQVSRYANEHIRKSDEDLQLFIHRIYSHLQTLADELNQIPMKTRVKVEENWKQIFRFNIPEWEEDVGKTRIRDYIEWILQQLESNDFFNENGVQDDGKVRKQIETWLQSKQLLRIVMNNEIMKVHCRKVTNDNKVTTRSYSWEQSNVWSGGEKWSKNMTLFLGILNYVAEKKKHIQSNMKRHRSVILDNPFGKASSDHVLSPVFFVAEQLGFQIIALTAHAEGKFLQDYFPIIYSCRLRASSAADKKVMTKEKWLHHAFFQDHDPHTIERIGETQQIGLFD
ncbi:chromosome segregation ATPase [Natronobacillus azotifigens]|uniref:Chromosome segregation ATPase n=1 Tax=Natronobacillus azotifigens TaxID=472978 RepID=A0A9J6R8N2_9BACI|nr:hypothetical protein [Natronobacillus azotifigens]MCZ0701596.1 hypothetical protein [Natronobacillus azotifigens]